MAAMGASTASSCAVKCQLQQNTCRLPQRLSHTKPSPRVPPSAAVASPTRSASTDSRLLDGPAALETQPRFQEYTQATQLMENLKSSTNDLQRALEELNEVEASLSLAAAPVDREERKVQRAAKRAARKASDSDHVTPTDYQHTTTTANAAPTHTHTDEQSLQSNKLQLEELWNGPPAEEYEIESPQQPTWPSVSTAVRGPHVAPKAPIKPLEPAEDDITASLLEARGPGQTSFLEAGPSLLAVPSVQAPGLTARARQARRNSNYSRQTTQAPAVALTAAPTKYAPPGSDGTSDFMKRAASSSVLGAEEEKQLMLVVQDYLLLTRIKEQVQEVLKRAPTTDEWAKAVDMDPSVFAKRLAVGQSAKQQMLKSNYRLVMSVSKKYQNRGTQMQDLVAEGIKGLLKAVERFDPNKGFRFSTYAHWWIMQSITRSMADQGRAVRLPVHLQEQVTKLDMTKNKLIGKLGRDPTLDELADATGFSVSRIESLYAAAVSSVSMDVAVNANDGGMETFGDTLEDGGPTPDQHLLDSSIKRDVEAMLNELLPREAHVIRYRYGLVDNTEWTLEAVGNTLGVTRERVRQIENKALRKLKTLQEKSGSLMQEYHGNENWEGHELAARASQGTRKT